MAYTVDLLRSKVGLTGHSPTTSIDRHDQNDILYSTGDMEPIADFR